MPPLLEVRDLEVQFATDDGVVRAVDGVSYSVDAGRSLGIVGESGSGKSVSNLTVLGLTRAKNASFNGEVLFEGRDLLTLSEEEMREIRGEEIAMIFQDPLSSLHPFYRVGGAARGGGPRAPQGLQGRGARQGDRDAAARRHPRAASRASTPTRTSSRAACASAR